jgi:two-component system cell cycle sensor histidine kinase/response regulator CckA
VVRGLTVRPENADESDGAAVDTHDGRKGRRSQGGVVSEDSAMVALRESGVGSGETVLVVDDDANVRHAVATLLRRRGYDVIEAADGENAMHALSVAPSPVDLLVTDFLMPNCSGTPLAQTLCEWYPWLKVLMISGYADVAAEVCRTMLPGVRVLAKPFDGKTLARVVSEVLTA